jgi:hypothetical protein
MIEHIVMWKLKDFAEGADKQENARSIKSRLEALKSKIKEIGFIEVGINIDDSPAANDVVLYTEFAGKEELEAYLRHPEHP